MPVGVVWLKNGDESRIRIRTRREHEQLVRRNMVEGGDALLEVLSDDLFWNMAKPVGHLGCVISRVADRQWDRMGSTWNEEAALKLPSGNIWSQRNHEVRSI